MTTVVEPTVPGAVSRRKLLQASVSCLCNEAGFSSVEETALESLTEIIQSFLTELGYGSRVFCELASRVEPVVGDVVMALVEMGIDQKGLETYASRSRRLVLPTPTQAVPSKQTGILQTGQRRPHPSHIPDHLPPFPDSHAYVQTPTHKQPVNDYETVREKASCQKRDVERALTRFIARTGETQSFFLTEDLTYFPLIACKPMDRPFLAALLPRDQQFEDDEAAVHMQKQEEANAEAIKAAKADQEKENSNKNAEAAANSGTGTSGESPVPGDGGSPNKNALNNSLSELNNAEIMENPFIRPVKMPHMSGKRKTTASP